MAWATGQKFGLYSSSDILFVKQEQNSGWTDLITIPQGELKPSTTYAFVACGLMGGFTPSTHAAAQNIGEITFRQEGTYYQVQHRMDLEYTGFRLVDTTKANGHPFCVILVTTTGAANPQPAFHLTARTDAVFIGSPPFPPSFFVDNPQVHVWDLSAVGAGNYRHAFSASTTTLSTTPTALASSSGLTNGKKWLIYTAAEFNHRQDSSGRYYMPVLWPTKTAASTSGFHRPRPTPNVGQSAYWVGHWRRTENPNRLQQRYSKPRLGDWITVDADTSFTAMNIYAQDVAAQAGTDHSQVTRADLLAINLTDTMSEVEFTYEDELSADRLFGESLNPDSVVKAHNFTTPVNADFFQCVRASQLVSGSRNIVRTASTQTEVLGQAFAPIKPFPLAVLTIDTWECLPQMRAVTAQTGPGKACMRMYGWHNVENAQLDTNLLSGTDLSFLSFFGRTGWTWPAFPDESAGPELEIVPGYEGLGVGSLPALPFAPSYAVPIEEVEEVADFETVTKYRVTFPLFVGGRRIWRLVWPALSVADGATLLAFLRARSATDGAFKWQPSDGTAEIAVRIAPQSGWQLEDIAGPPSSVRGLEVIELVHTGP